MASVYQIKYTDGIRTITIQPGTLNGPGGVLSDSDLQLFGQGTLAWGAGVDQNLLRLIENFACPESILTPGEPMGDAEIGVVGAGINNPNEGQIWFNTTTENLFFYDGTIWVSAGSVFVDAAEPTNAVVGTLWYDTSGIPQLKVCSSIGPIVFTSVADRYLLKAGDTMTGDINMTASAEVLGLPAVPAATGAASKEYVDDQISTLSGSATLDFVDAAGDLMTGDLTIEKTNPHLLLNALSGGVGALRFQTAGVIEADLKLDGGDVFLRRRPGAVTDNEIRLRATYIDTTGTGNGKIRTPTTVGGDNIAVVTTKGYVDSEILAATASGAAVQTDLSSGGIGDIAVSGGKIYINLAAGVNWKQVWPAVYT